MQITPDQLLAEAAHMALELRLKDQEIGRLEAEVARLQPTLPTASADTPQAGSGTPDPAPRSPLPAGDAGNAPSGADGPSSGQPNHARA